MRMMLDVRQRMVDFNTAVIATSGRLRRGGLDNAAFKVALVVVTALIVSEPDLGFACGGW